MTAIRTRPSPNRHPFRYAGLRVHERFAGGNSSSVCFGWLVRRSKLCAVKRMHPFHTVSEPARRIAHPNVVQTIGVFHLPNEQLAAMEYVPGASLAEIGQLSPAIASAVVADVLRGLQEVHGARLGALPSGLSPPSILVGDDGRARVLDLDVHGPITTAALVHKLPYASPEQVLQRDHPADVRRDVYAASVVLWELLAGRRLFRGPTIESTIGSILRGDVPPPSTFASHVDPALDAIVLRGLSRHPSDRFSSASAMAAELERASDASHEEIADALAALDLPCIMRRRAMAADVITRESNALHIECTEGVPKA